jgi:hypothetical protein
LCILEIDIPVAQSTAVSSVNAALEAAAVIGYPVILRSAFTLGGLGSGFANNPDELRDLSAKSLSLSPQVLIERSMKGWKELEYEVVRDAADVGILLIVILSQLFDISMFRTPSFAAIWRILTPSEHTQETLLSLRRRRRCPMTNTTCSAVLLLRSLGILASSVNVIFNMPSILPRWNTALLKSMLGMFFWSSL